MLDRYFDQLAVGDVFSGTRGRTITDTDLALFSAVSGDWSPLHNDAAFAATGPFGARIAHGLLLISMMTGLAPISGQAVVALYAGVPFLRYKLLRYESFDFLDTCGRVIVVEDGVVTGEAFGAEEFFGVECSVWFAELCVSFWGYVA